VNNEIFVIGAWLDNKVKEENLISVIKEIKSKNYPVCLVTHCIVSKDIQELVDYFIYEKENILSNKWRLLFWRMKDGVRQERLSEVDYHGVACLMNIRNAVDLLLAKGKFKYIHYREADLTYDFDKYMNLFKNKMLANNKKALFTHFQDEKYRTDLFSVDVDWYNVVIPRAQSWEEYVKIPNSGNLTLEYWFYEQIERLGSFDDIVFIKDLVVGNKWTQAHYVPWDEDTRAKLDFADIPSQDDDFKKIMETLYKTKNIDPQIVEIGVGGTATPVFAWYISKYGGSYYGCDSSKENINNAAQILKIYITGSDKSTIVTLTENFGDEYIKEYNHGSIDLLYLSTYLAEELYRLELLLTAVNKLTIGGFVVLKEQDKALISYLMGDNRFMCIYKKHYFIFRRDI